METVYTHECLQRDFNYFIDFLQLSQVFIHNKFFKLILSQISLMYLSSPG